MYAKGRLQGAIVRPRIVSPAPPGKRHNGCFQDTGVEEELDKRRVVNGRSYAIVEAQCIDAAFVR